MVETAFSVLMTVVLGSLALCISIAMIGICVMIWQDVFDK